MTDISNDYENKYAELRRDTPNPTFIYTRNDRVTLTLMP